MPLIHRVSTDAASAAIVSPRETAVQVASESPRNSVSPLVVRRNRDLAVLEATEPQKQLTPAEKKAQWKKARQEQAAQAAAAEAEKAAQVKAAEEAVWGAAAEGPQLEEEEDGDGSTDSTGEEEDSFDFRGALSGALDVTGGSGDGSSSLDEDEIDRIEVQKFDQGGETYLVDYNTCAVFKDMSEDTEPEEVGRWDPVSETVVLVDAVQLVSLARLEASGGSPKLPPMPESPVAGGGWDTTYRLNWSWDGATEQPCQHHLYYAQKRKEAASAR